MIKVWVLIVVMQAVSLDGGVGGFSHEFKTSQACQEARKKVKSSSSFGLEIKAFCVEDDKG